MAEAIAAPIATNLVSELGKLLFAPIGRQFGYVLYYKSNVQDLKNGVEKLEAALERVRHSVKVAEDNDKPIESYIEGWLEKAENKAKEARILLGRVDIEKDACLHGWLLNPVVRHPIGRKVKKMTPVIQGLHDESTKSNFQEVYSENPPIGSVPPAPPPATSTDNKGDVLESRAKITEEVMNALVDDKIRVIGVYGPGGVGKSKLLKDIKRQVKENNLFGKVAMANVKRNRNIERIQSEITDSLGMHLINEKTVYGRAHRLNEKLKKDSEKNILIILDDLWEKLDLKEIGIPCEDDDNKVDGCKLLLTSRNRDVLRIAMCSDQDFRLDELNHEEARRLFERTVGDRAKDPEFETCLDGVVNNCGGLPLLIVPMAKRLKYKDLAAWRNASTNRDLSDVKSVVELSYNDIKDERIRSLFLVCALNYGRISARDSLIYCMGLGFYKKYGNTIQKARDRLIEDLHTLQDSSLLQESAGDFKMHDIFVDVVISLHVELADMKWNALVGKKDYGFKEWTEDELRTCTAISFSLKGIDELPQKLDCPNLRMLLFFENKSLEISELFFESMENLQVLDLTNFSFTTLPSSIQVLQHLKSLSLDFCHLEDVTFLGKLKGLQFLSFFRSTIARLPKEIGELTELRFLDLSGCFGLEIIEPGVLESLFNLEELYIDTFSQWGAEDEAPRRNASLAELNKMEKLKTLHIAVPQSTNLPSDLPIGNLNEHKIQIGGNPRWWRKYKESRTLKLKLDSDNLLQKVWMQQCLGRTQDLRLDGLNDGRDTIHDLCIDGFRELKHLHVKNSPSFQFVVHSTQFPAFTRLESLVLKNLDKLVEICRDCLAPAPECFSRLKTVKVKNCGGIKHLFPSSMTRIFLQLEEIEIMECHLIQQIVANAETNEYKDETNDDANMKLSKLRRLTLQNLPKMTSFYKTREPSVFFLYGQQLKELRSLEAITIENCRLIKGIFNLEGLTANGEVEILMRLKELILRDLPSLGCIWNKNPQRILCFGNLRTLKVQNCDNLRFLFSSSMAKALGQIKEIEIVSCKSMEEIIDVQEEELEEAVTTDNLEFPQLTSLSLEELPNLRTFSYGKYLIICPSLIRLKISQCPEMMTFSSLSGRQQSMTIDTDLHQAFGPFNFGLSLPGFFNDKVVFPSLEELKLLSMCQLKRIWHNQLPRQSFCKLASVTIERCENLSHVFPSNFIDSLQSLNKIEVVECPSLEGLFEPVILSSEKRQKPLVLSALNKMTFLNLPRLRDILKSDYKAILAFPSLTEVNVRDCHSLLYLFSSATARTLEEIAVIDVSCCNNLQGIIAIEEGNSKTGQTLRFRHLSTLKLCDLESLIGFSSKCSADEGLHPLFDEKLVFPKLEELHIEGVQQKEIWNDKILVESFCRLKVLTVKQCPYLMNVFPSFVWKRLLHRIESLTVEECRSLRNLFTMSMAKSLGQLQHLGLGGCGEMEYIFSGEEERIEGGCDRIMIPELVTLYLHNMPKLRSCCRGKHISEWPSLKKFTIEDCKAVEVIFGDASCTKPKDSGQTQQTLLLTEKIEFPNMESMKISHMNNIEQIWLGELASNASTKLKTLEVKYCEKLSSIFSSHTILTRFQNLKKITITDCGSLEVVFQVQEVNFSGTTSKIELSELNLERLPKMKHIWSGPLCGTLAFECLRCLEVESCENLKSIFPVSIAKSTTQLEELTVRSCGVEEIMAEEDGVGLSAGDLFFPRLTNLLLFELPELRRFSRSSHTTTWPLLKVLVVSHCDKIRLFSFACEFQSCQDTITNENRPTLFSFEEVSPTLKGLGLRREDVVLLQQQQQHVFGDLKSLFLSCYHDENDAFPSDFLLQRFPNLELLVVMCSSFEEIFAEDASGHGGAVVPCGGLTEMQKPLQVPGELIQLCLYKLDNLRRVWKEGSLMTELLKQIENLHITECPSLSIVLPSLTSFQRLTQLEVQNCAALVHLGTCLAMTSLVQLRRLTLGNCAAMEELVTDDENGPEEISFPKMKELILDGLLRLESFSSMSCAFNFPSLDRVVIKECPKMNIFCKGALSTPNLTRVLLSKDDDEGPWEGDLNATVRTLSA